MDDHEIECTCPIIKQYYDKNISWCPKDSLKMSHQIIPHIHKCFCNFDIIKRLFCNSCQIETISSLPPLLITLKLENNKLAYLDPTIIPKTLLHAYLPKNNLMNFTFVSNIIEVDLSYNKIKNLDLSDSNVEKLTITHNNLENLKCNNKIRRLWVSHNPNIKIDFNNCTSLNELGISYCEIQSLNNYAFPNSLTELNVYHNYLTSIDSLPPKLQSLNCSLNKIEQIVNIPQSLHNLSISGNKLSELIINETNIGSLNCCSNRLKKIHTSPKTNIIVCNDNNITEMILGNTFCKIEYQDVLYKYKNLVIMPIEIIYNLQRQYNEKSHKLHSLSDEIIETLMANNLYSVDI